MANGAATMTMLVVLAQSISISPNAEGGPGGVPMQRLTNYTSYMGFRVLAILFLISLVAAAVARWGNHMAAQSWGIKGAVTVLLIVVVLAMAAPILNFADTIGRAGSAGSPSPEAGGQ